MTERSTKRRRKRKWRWLRYRKNDLDHNVTVAVQRWIHANGGTAVMIGGIGVMDQGRHCYQVCVGALGLLPKKKAALRARQAGGDSK